MPLSPAEFIFSLLYSLSLIGLIVTAWKRKWKIFAGFAVAVAFALAANAWLASN